MNTATLQVPRFVPALTVISTLLLAFHLYVLWGFSYMAGASTLPLATALFFAGPFIALVAAVSAAVPPRRRPLLAANLVIVGLYVVIWLPQLSRLEWRGS